MRFRGERRDPPRRGCVSCFAIEPAFCPSAIPGKDCLFKTAKAPASEGEFAQKEAKLTSPKGEHQHTVLGAMLDAIQERTPDDSGIVFSSNRPDCGWWLMVDGREAIFYEDGTWEVLPLHEAADTNTVIQRQPQREEN